MTRAVFLDFYNTLACFDPPREESQARACSEFGLEASPKALRRAIVAADDYYYREAVKTPISERPEAEKQAIFAEYERRILQGAGLEVSPELAFSIWQRIRAYPQKVALYDDALPTIQALKARGLVLGIVSNITRDKAGIFQELGLDTWLDFIVTSVEVPPGKPHPTIFLRALERAGALAAETIHVGDQYHIDVAGARAVGIRPLLLDREDFYVEVTDCPRLRHLGEVEVYL